MKKILIFYGSYGGGHLSAAKSISKYLDVEDLDPDYGLWDGTPKVKNTNHLKKNYETL